MPHEARNGRPAPGLARSGLVLGVGATVSAHGAHGLAFGPLGAVISAWPACAFIIAAELAIGVPRRGRDRGAAAGAALRALGPPEVAADAEHAARLALAASLAAGNPLSQRQVMTRLGLTRAAERRVRQAVTAGSNPG